ncbi:uncharacterized protein LOC122320844 [Drosophila ficusphila]|uniref:uncharacterized protein LOC122320844 n=1 Tax=Drosophila ficusphila TaxID=30025 RepID=UPI001C896284|nr:uncharacterized protein LOC122320844 [Drosophila ficusphila]
MNALYDLPVIVKECSTEFKHLLNVTNVCINEFKRLKIAISTCDHWIVHHLAMKLPSTSLQAWEHHLGSSGEIPTFSMFENFLNNRLVSIEMIESRKGNPLAKPTSVQNASHKSSYKLPNNSNNNNIHKRGSYHTTSGTNSAMRCTHCSGNHILRRCPEFLSKDCFARKLIAENTKHQSTRDSSSSASSIQANTTQLVSAMASYKSPTVILATVLVRLHNNITGQSMIVRALIDHGSEGTLVTENVVQDLGLRRFPVSAEITGVGENSTNKCKHRTGFTLSSCIHPQFQMSVDTAFVLRSLTSPLPRTNIYLQNWSHIQGLELADPTFTRSGRIDLLIGVDVIPQLMLSEVRKGAQDQPIAQRTQLGWIVFGKTNQIFSHAISIRCHQTNLESLVNMFFELEIIPETRQLTAEEQWCEDHFKRTHTRQPNGKYMVRLPFKTQFDSSQVLGKSRQIALNRFHMLERKFQKQPALHQQYSAVIQEYFDLN